MTDTSASNDDVRSPSSIDEQAARWGRYIVQHFEPKAGDVFFIRGPSPTSSTDMREKMADAIEAAVPDEIYDDVYLIIGRPDQSLSQIPEKEMNRLGWRRDGDPSPIPKDSHNADSPEQETAL